MLLGELEHALMEEVWTLGTPATAREIHERVVGARDIELITAITVLNRLVDPKRLLRRKKKDGLYHYSAVLSREEFVLRGSRHVLKSVMGLGMEAVTVSFVDALAEYDAKQLTELGRLVRRKLREKAQE